MQSLFLSTQTSFQVVLATNGNESYVILVYSDLSDFAVTDYQAAFEAGNRRDGAYIHLFETSSEIGNSFFFAYACPINGSYAFRIDGMCVVCVVLCMQCICLQVTV